MANIKVSEVVGMFLDEINGGPNEYARAYRMARRIWRQVNWDITGRNYTVDLEVSCDLTAKLPEDFINDVVVGIRDYEGDKIHALTYDENLYVDCGYGEDVSDPSLHYGGDGYFNTSNQPMMNSRGSLGIGSQNVLGLYRIDKGAGIIILDPGYQYSTITLRYLGGGQESGDLEINELASEALLAGVRWVYNISRKGVTQTEKRDLKREFTTQKRLAKMRIKKPLLQVMNQMARESIKQSIKS